MARFDEVLNEAQRMREAKTQRYFDKRYERKQELDEMAREADAFIERRNPRGRKHHRAHEY